MLGISLLLWKPQTWENLVSARVLLIWFVCYGIWGIVVSPVPVASIFLRDLIRFVTIAIALSVITDDPKSLRLLAKLAPLVIVLNLLISLSIKDSLPYTNFLIGDNLAHADAQTRIDRYAGLWGNANEAGLNVLVLLVVSFFSFGWLTLSGLLAAPWMIYLTASRTTTYLFLLLTSAYIIRVRRLRWIAGIVVVIAFMLVAFDVVPLPEIASLEDSKGRFARVFDPTESKTVNGTSRYETAVAWIPAIMSKLWTGYGYDAMSGAGSVNVVTRSDVPYLGTHNMYIGTVADAGILGGISYILLLIIGIWRAFRSRLTGVRRTTGFALLSIVVICSMTHHSLEASIDGQTLLLLCFLVPQCRALNPVVVSSRPVQRKSRKSAYANI